MAYDGLFIKLQIKEISKIVLNEHIAKITQASHKEVDFHIRKNNKNYILRLSANPNFPHILLSNNDFTNLNTPPSFCMLLRKYLQSGIIKNIIQVGCKIDNNFDNNMYLERIVKFEFENINENGDIANYFIYFEIMGKYSNIIITDENNIIIDTLIKTNSENERLKTKNLYSINEISTKTEILNENDDGFMKAINDEIALTILNNETFDLSTTISKKYAGLSKPFILHLIILYLASKKNINIENLNYEHINRIISEEDYKQLFKFIKQTILDIMNKNFKVQPVINYKYDKPSDFYLFKLITYQGEIKTYDTINECLEQFVENKYENINDSNDEKNLNSIIKSLYSKLNKKLTIYKNNLSKCDELEKYKTYAELISCFGYNKEKIKDGSLICEDYNNDNRIVSIPIDETITISQNVEKYYDRYNKLKRTKENAENLILETTNKLEHLSTIENSLKISNDKNDLYLIKEEILKYFDEANKIQILSKQKSDIRNRKNYKSNKSYKLNYNIHHYKSTSGIDIYLGKNNLQNEYLTFTIANSNDTWLHVKNATGSHVIIKKPYEELDDKTLIEAASLAAYFSEKKNETKATVDYTLRKELKKVKGKSPGFCIYHKNYSINVKPEVLIKEIK